MEIKKTRIIEASILAIGLIVLGLCLKGGIDNFVNKDRKVTVKGLAEMEVEANHVTWPIVTKETGNDLPSLYNTIDTKTTRIVQFLKDNGVKEADISINPPVVVDKNATDYNSERSADRYNITSVITVSSTEVEKVRGIIEKQGELLRDGIAIVDGGYENPVSYEYTSFAEIKPKMMDDAIESAKKTAVQFAEKGGMKLNKIETADQGVFSIEDRDENSPHIKQLRVVTTITYSLDD